MIWRRFISGYRFGTGLILLGVMLTAPVLGAPETAPPDAPPAKSSIAASGLPLPRFVSISSARVNLRVGPGRQFPIAWILHRRHLPVEVIAEFEHWRKIREPGGDAGWVHKTMLSGKRMAMVIGNGKTGELIPAYEKAAPGKMALMAEDGAIGEISACNGEWCAIKFEKAGGWMRRDTLWGVYPTEDFD